MGAFKLVVDSGLGASLNTGDPIAHGVHASLGGVDSDDLLKSFLASLELLLPVSAMRLALLENQLFGVLASLQHRLDIVGSLLEARRVSGIVNHPARCEP